MLTLSILWVVLAAAVTMLATMKKAPARMRQDDTQVRESVRALPFLAVIYGITLLAGFVYISKFVVSTL
jgi:hypothetical protein